MSWLTMYLVGLAVSVIFFMAIDYFDKGKACQPLGCLALALFWPISWLLIFGATLGYVAKTCLKPDSGRDNAVE